MDCPFCSQWNPPDYRRCCFCGNLADAEQDGTVAARPAYEGKPLPTTLSTPQVQRPRSAPRKVRAGRVTLELTSGQWIGVGVFLLFLITTLSSRCS